MYRLSIRLDLLIVLLLLGVISFLAALPEPQVKTVYVDTCSGSNIAPSTPTRIRTPVATTLSEEKKPTASNQPSVPPRQPEAPPVPTTPVPPPPPAAPVPQTVSTVNSTTDSEDTAANSTNVDDVEAPALATTEDVVSKVQKLFGKYNSDAIDKALQEPQSASVLAAMKLDDVEGAGEKRSEEDVAFAEKMEHRVDELIGELTNSTQVFATHQKYMLLKEHLAQKLDTQRKKTMLETQRTKCLEFPRTEQTSAEVIYRVPCVPWDTPNLVSAQIRTFGVLATFDHIAVPQQLPATKTTPAVESSPLKIAVEMSGHMRTYRRCYESLVKNLLEPNQALLFIATYPDLGDKRYGIRVQEYDLEVPVKDLQAMYSPYLAAAYMGDLPTVSRKLGKWFPTVFHLKQWSWMIYQLFMMELAHNTTLGHTTLHAQEIEHSDPTQYTWTNPKGKGRGSNLWPDFDIVIRVRPDLFILGEAVVRAMTPTKAVFNFTCGNATFTEPFSTNDIIRAPHHPVYEWFSDPISDHSAIGYKKELTAFMWLFNSAKKLDTRDQGIIYFKHGNTAERMWSDHTNDKKLHAVRTVGWHIMLRNPEKFLNSTVKVANSQRRAEMTKKVFGVTDPSQVGCPAADRSMVRLGKKPKLPPGKFLKRK